MIVYHAEAAFKGTRRPIRGRGGGYACSPRIAWKMTWTRGARWLVVAAGLTAATLLAWLLTVSGVGAPATLSRLLVLFTSVWILVGVISSIRRGARAESDEVRATTWALVVLTLVSFVVRYVGLAFELTTHFHNDEGIFLEIAREMLEGDLLPTRFHYPHLLYYLSAITLWVGDLFPAVTASVASWGFGASRPRTPRASSFGC